MQVVNVCIENCFPRQGLSTLLFPDSTHRVSASQIPGYLKALTLISSGMYFSRMRRLSRTPFPVMERQMGNSSSNNASRSVYIIQDLSLITRGLSGSVVISCGPPESCLHEREVTCVVPAQPSLTNIFWLLWATHSAVRCCRGYNNYFSILIGLHSAWHLFKRPVVVMLLELTG